MISQIARFIGQHGAHLDPAAQDGPHVGTMDLLSGIFMYGFTIFRVVLFMASLLRWETRRAREDVLHLVNAVYIAQEAYFTLGTKRPVIPVSRQTCGEGQHITRSLIRMTWLATAMLMFTHFCIYSCGYKLRGKSPMWKIKWHYTCTWCHWCITLRIVTTIMSYSSPKFYISIILSCHFIWQWTIFPEFIYCLVVRSLFIVLLWI